MELTDGTRENKLHAACNAEVKRLELQISEVNETLKHHGLEPWPDGRSVHDGKRPWEQHIGMVISSLKAECDSANRLNDEYLTQIEWAWGVIANAGPEGCMGNWSKQDPKWVEIAEKWRDQYHAILNKRQKR